MELYRIPNGCLSAFGRVEVYRIPTEIYLSQLSLIHTISINNSVVFQLQRIPILNHLSYELLFKLVRTSVVKSVRAGEVIYRRGDPPDHFYIILSCAIVSYNVSREENKSRIAGFLYPGDYFGEGTILNNNPRRATVTILNSGILLEITREQFTEYLKGCREALKENYLSPVVEGVAALAHEFGGEHAVHFLLAASLFGVDNFHHGQLQPFVAGEQRHKTKAAALGFVICFDRWRG